MSADSRLPIRLFTLKGYVLEYSIEDHYEESSEVVERYRHQPLSFTTPSGTPPLLSYPFYDTHLLAAELDIPEDLARSEAYSRTLEARITLLETEARRHEWQRQAADDLAVRHIMRIQALEAGARIDTLEDTGSSS
ncbi:hypothetical protein Tco_0064104 [Tanacetum coccineum]